MGASVSGNRSCWYFCADMYMMGILLLHARQLRATQTNVFPFSNMTSHQQLLQHQLPHFFGNIALANFFAVCLPTRHLLLPQVTMHISFLVQSRVPSHELLFTFLNLRSPTRVLPLRCSDASGSGPNPNGPLRNIQNSPSLPAMAGLPTVQAIESHLVDSST